MTEQELALKRVKMLDALERNRLAALRLRRVDWFSWATCGGSSMVILTAESGVGEVLVTRQGAWVLTDDIEAERLRQEEVPAGLTVLAGPWNSRAERDAFVAEQAGGGLVASDRPTAGEWPLPPELVSAKRRLLDGELERYRALGRDAGEAVTETLTRAQPDWTELQLAGAAAEALWRRGIHPALTLVAGERRLPIFRHPTAGPDRLDGRAMLVVCGRRHGLYANLTRFVYFRQPTVEERRLADHVAEVEAVAWVASTPGANLETVYNAIVAAYARLGHPGAEMFHHQGGTTGYLGRELIAVPGLRATMQANTALAWNPSLRGSKIEDTVVTSDRGIEILTADPAWPTRMVAGRPRPDLLIRA